MPAWLPGKSRQSNGSKQGAQDCAFNSYTCMYVSLSATICGRMSVTLKSWTSYHASSLFLRTCSLYVPPAPGLPSWTTLPIKSYFDGSTLSPLPANIRRPWIAVTLGNRHSKCSYSHHTVLFICMQSVMGCWDDVKESATETLLALTRLCVEDTLPVVNEQQ